MSAGQYHKGIGLDTHHKGPGNVSDDFDMPVCLPAYARVEAAFALSRCADVRHKSERNDLHCIVQLA